MGWDGIGTEYRVLGIGYWVLGTGYWILEPVVETRASRLETLFTFWRARAVQLTFVVSQPGQHLTLTWLENSKVKKPKQRWGSRDREPKAWTWGDNFTCCLLPLTQ